jgi:hypothetical protein
MYFRDEPIEPGHSFGDRTVMGADYVSQILGVEPRGEFGRTDQIAEHKRELAPFRAIAPKW